jgi:hypothetical protein
MTAIERRDNGAISVPLGGALPDIRTAMEFARVMAVSELIPVALRGKPGNVLAVVLYGQEIGLGAMQAMNNVHVVEGKPVMSAELWRAKLREHGHNYYIPCTACGGPPKAHPEVAPEKPTPREHAYRPEHDEKHCKLRVIRGDNGERGDFEYTIDEAVAAGKVRIVDGKAIARSERGKVLNWEAHTKDMLFARVTTRGCRAIAPEIALGWVIQDEADEIAERERVEASRVDTLQAAPEATRPEDVAAAVEAIEAEYVDDTPTDQAPPEYACTVCGQVGHYEDLCPEATG